jgi:hypothetical protein
VLRKCHTRQTRSVTKVSHTSHTSDSSVTKVSRTSHSGVKQDISNDNKPSHFSSQTSPGTFRRVAFLWDYFDCWNWTNRIPLYLRIWYDFTKRWLIPILFVRWERSSPGAICCHATCETNQTDVKVKNKKVSQYDVVLKLRYHRFRSFWTNGGWLFMRKGWEGEGYDLNLMKVDAYFRPIFFGNQIQMVG